MPCPRDPSKRKALTPWRNGSSLRHLCCLGRRWAELGNQATSQPWFHLSLPTMRAGSRAKSYLRPADCAKGRVNELLLRLAAGRHDALNPHVRHQIAVVFHGVRDVEIEHAEPGDLGPAESRDHFGRF